MKLTKCIVACTLLAGTAYAAQAPPPTTVDAADPSPAVAPHLDTHQHASIPVDLSSAKILPPGSLPFYDGTEYTVGPLKIRPAQLQLEAAMLGIFFLYSVITYVGRRVYCRRANAWFTSNESVLRAEFAGVGFGGKELFKSDGGSEFVSYFSGRRAIEYGWAKIDMGGYDALSSLYFTARSTLEPTFDVGLNRVVIDLKLALPVGTPGARFCFAVLRRDMLKKLRDARWDLRTFTTLSENPSVSPELIVMTESGDITNALLRDQVTGLQDAMSRGAEGLEWFESLVVSDMPTAEPDASKPTLPTDDYRLTLTLRLPPAARSRETARFITLACNIADVLYKKEKLIPEVAVSKLKKRRAEVLATLLKPLEEETRLVEATKKADAIALKRKLEQDKIDDKLKGMSASERIKFKQKEEEKERKKRVLKMNKKQR